MLLVVNDKYELYIHWHSVPFAFIFYCVILVTRVVLFWINYNIHVSSFKGKDIIIFHWIPLNLHVWTSYHCLWRIFDRFLPEPKPPLRQSAGKKSHSIAVQERKLMTETSRNGDSKIMQTSRITSGPLIRIKKWNQFSQFRWTSVKVMSIKKV